MEFLEEFYRNGKTSELDALDLLEINARRKRFLKSICPQPADDDFTEELEKTREDLAYLRPLGNKRHCVFCKNNKEKVAVYSTHLVKNENGDVVCPILSKYTCPLCFATGKKAHTIKYCPLNDGFSTVDYILKTPRNGAGKKRN
uniref:Nanos-type domain-containing protein n=1 Tax=Biomphalaria glabrata TaxID=6526 RepID=A0A2C9M0V2_BIOGL